MAGLGYGELSSQQTIQSALINLILKLAFFVFVLYADKKLHWFDEIKRDDVAEFNERSK